MTGKEALTSMIRAQEDENNNNKRNVFGRSVENQPLSSMMYGRGHLIERSHSQTFFSEDNGSSRMLFPTLLSKPGSCRKFSACSHPHVSNQVVALNAISLDTGTAGCLHHPLVDVELLTNRKRLILRRILRPILAFLGISPCRKISLATLTYI